MELRSPGLLSRVWIDGHELRCAVSVGVHVQAGMDAPRVTLQLEPLAVEIYGEAEVAAYVLGLLHGDQEAPGDE